MDSLSFGVRSGVINTLCRTGESLGSRSLVQLHNIMAFSNSVPREILSNLGLAPFLPMQKHLFMDTLVLRCWWHMSVTKSVSCFFLVLPSSEADSGMLRVMVIEEFLHTALLYQASNTRNINAVAVLEQYLVLVEKE